MSTKTSQSEHQEAPLGDDSRMEEGDLSPEVMANEAGDERQDGMVGVKFRPFARISAKFQRYSRTGWGRVLGAFVENTAPQIHSGANWVAKGFWTLAYIGLTGVFFYQMTALTKQYFKYDVTTSISIMRTQNAQFPSVAICNNSPVRKDIIGRITRFAALAALDELAESAMYEVFEDEADVQFEFLCSDGFHECPTDGICIGSYQLCDQEWNCEDGWDEGAAPDQYGNSIDCDSHQAHLASYQAWNTGGYCLAGYVVCGDREPLCAIPCDGDVECHSGLDESEELGCSQDFRCYQELNAAGTPASFTTQNHPDDYESLSDCIWKITAQVGEIVSLTFDSANFEIESEDDECFDFVSVFNEDGQDKPIATICGKTPPGDAIESSGRVMIVKFESDFTGQKSGFTANYVSVPASRRLRRETKPNPVKRVKQKKKHEAMKRAAKHAKRAEFARRDRERTISNYRKRQNLDKIREKRSIEAAENQEFYEEEAFLDEYAYETWYENLDPWEQFKNISDFDWFAVYLAASDPSYLDFRSFALFSKDQVRWFGTKARDFIAQCSYDGRHCDGKDFVVKENPTFGNCFHFNSILGTDKKKGDFIPGIRRTSNTGQEFGLKLTLFLDKENYIGVLAPDSGVQVVLSPPTIEGRPESEATQASAGFTTRIAVQQLVISRQGGKYGSCDESWPPELDFPARFTAAWPTYSQQVCQSYCVVRRMLHTCNCTDNFFSDIEGMDDADLERGVMLCETWLKEERDCRMQVYKDYRAEEFECPCNPACDSDQYSKLQSTSEWPTVQFTPYFVKNLLKETKSERIQAFLERLLLNGNMTTEGVTNEIRKNFLRLEVFFQDLNFEHISEKPAYTLVNWVTDFGGNIGLWIGWSVLTMLEAVILLSGLVKVAIGATAATE